MKKKLLLVLFMMLILVGFTGCGKENDIDEKVILNKEKVKVIAKTINYEGELGPEIEVEIENNSSKEVIVQASSISINDIMVHPTLNETIKAGKKVKKSIVLYAEEFDLAKISIIKDIELELRVYDSETWEEIVRENVKLKTNTKDYVQEYFSGGTLILEQEGIKVYTYKAVDEDSFWGQNVYFYIENNSSKDVTLYSHNVTIGELESSASLGATIKAGKKNYGSMKFEEEEFKTNNITDITEINLEFNVVEPDTEENIFKTDVINVKYN